MLTQFKINYLVKAIRNGWIQLDKTKRTAPEFYDIWVERVDDLSKRAKARVSAHVPAPKPKLPGALSTSGLHLLCRG